jgi:hypothetical protein
MHQRDRMPIETMPFARDLWVEKSSPLEFDAGVPMVITICLRIPQECLQKINHKETYHDIHTFERYYWQM